MNCFVVSSLPYRILHWPRPSAEMKYKTDCRAFLEQGEEKPSGRDIGTVNSH